MITVRPERAADVDAVRTDWSSTSPSWQNGRRRNRGGGSGTSRRSRMEIGGPVRTTKYYCPYCGKSQWLFSLAPVLTDEWVCTKCRRPCHLDTWAIAHNWLST